MNDGTSPAEAILDHLLLGVADLDRGIDWVEQRTGARAAMGGSHPGRGTRNALVSLGDRQYLEIIAPDPEQPGIETRPAHLHALIEPRLVWWAAAATNVADLSKTIRRQGLDVSGPRDGSRARPDGRILKWTTLGVTTTLAADTVDPIPFFIEWARETLHPAQDAPPGGRFMALEFEHPVPEWLAATLRKIGVDAIVKRSTAVRIVAALDTPKGNVILA